MILNFLHLFALDGAVKITLLGFNVSIPLLLSGILLPFSINKEFINLFKKVFREERFLILFVLYSFFSLAWSLNTSYGARLILQFMIPSIILYLFLLTHAHIIHNSRFWEVMLFLLILTGYIQIFLYCVYNYQIDFRGFGRVFYDYSFGYRLRGFFQEPNWYGLFTYFSFANYYIFCKYENKKMHPFLLLGVIIIMLLGRNRAVTLLLLGIVFIQNINIKKHARILFISLLLIFGFVFPYIAKDYTGSVRVGSIVRTYNYVKKNFSIADYIFGKGWGSWSVISYKHTLGHVFARGDINIGNLIIGGRADSNEYTMTFVEVGLIGFMLLLLDLSLIFVNCFRFENTITNRLAFLFLFSITGIAFFYPFFTFMPYMIAYMSIRSFVKLQYINKEMVIK